MESSELLRRIRAEINKTLEIPSPEWKSTDQWGKIWGLKSAQTGRLLRIAVDKGLMESRKFRIPCQSRGSYPIPHFREIPKEK